MILVTGPTGSGKTLTLYTFMRELDRDTLNLCTIEDPSEIRLAGINQVSINERAGLSFAVALRALLRQDPDVIMVGEIRDAETAAVAVAAAQTGHLLLATLHTNDAPTTLARLIDLGVEPYNVAAAVRLVTAQRLVRRLCSACRIADTLDPVALRAAGMAATHIDAALAGHWIPYRPIGCSVCNGTGFVGRCAIHQVMAVTPTLQERIAARAPTHELAAAMRAAGLPTLRDAALARVRDGTTSLHEALAATHDA
jgi:type IV pilus assembly protein PilB